VKNKEKNNEIAQIVLRTAVLNFQVVKLLSNAFILLAKKILATHKSQLKARSTLGVHSPA